MDFSTGQTTTATEQHALLVNRIRQMALAVQKDPPHIGVLSTGERCAVALILDEADLLDSGDTLLWAAQRVGREWLDICWQIQRDGLGS